MSYTIHVNGCDHIINEPDMHHGTAIREFRTPFIKWLRVQFRLAFEDLAAYLAR